MIFGQKNKTKSKKRIWFINDKDSNDNNNSQKLEHRKDARVDYIFFKAGDPRVKIKKND